MDLLSNTCEIIHELGERPIMCINVYYFFTLSKIILWMRSRAGRETGVRVEVGVAQRPT